MYRFNAEDPGQSLYTPTTVGVIYVMLRNAIIACALRANAFLLGAEQKPHPKLQDLMSRHYIRFRCRMALVLHARMHTFRCLQAANQCRSATMPSFKGAKSWVSLLYRALLFALQNVAAVPFNFNRVVCTAI